jgi:hypothetical protein
MSPSEERRGGGAQGKRRGGAAADVPFAGRYSSLVPAASSLGSCGDSTGRSSSCPIGQLEEGAELESGGSRGAGWTVVSPERPSRNGAQWSAVFRASALASARVAGVWEVSVVPLPSIRALPGRTHFPIGISRQS